VDKGEQAGDCDECMVFQNDLVLLLRGQWVDATQKGDISTTIVCMMTVGCQPVPGCRDPPSSIWRRDPLAENGVISVVANPNAVYDAAGDQEYLRWYPSNDVLAVAVGPKMDPDSKGLLRLSFVAGVHCKRWAPAFLLSNRNKKLILN